MVKKIVIQLILLISGIFFLITSNLISTIGFQGDVLNQKDYVVILAWLLIVFSALSIASEFIKERRGGVEKKSEAEMKMAELEAESQTQKVEKSSKAKIYISMFLVLLFAYGFTYIGFYVTSFIFVFLITWLMYDWDKKKWLNSLLFSVGLNVVLFVLFNLINVYFPKTLLF